LPELVQDPASAKIPSHVQLIPMSIPATRSSVIVDGCRGGSPSRYSRNVGEMLDEHVLTRIDDALVSVVLPADAVVRTQLSAHHFEDLRVALGLALMVRAHDEPVAGYRWRMVCVFLCHVSVPCSS